MTTPEATISKVQQLPEPLVQEVSDFIDFLGTKDVLEVAVLLGVASLWFK